MKKIIVIAGFISVFASGVLNAFAGYFSNASVNTCDSSITYHMSYGARGGDVTILQSILFSEGYLSATPNGNYGQQTRAAVRAFQADHGISQTGSVGPQTRDALNEVLCRGNDNSNGYSFNPYNYSQGATYVGQNDPFVTVINPPVAPPIIYNNPQSGYTSTVSVGGQATFVPANQNVIQMGSSYNPSQIASTQVIYSPQIGYTYGITPSTGSVTVSSPVANAIYKEGDTVYVQWGTNNLRAYTFTILLESNISGQSKVVGVTSGNSLSFVLTRELLDSVCGGTCNNNQTGSFKVVVTTPTTDIANITSTLRAAVAPITIKRPLSNATVNISGSKTPVNSAEVFKLYVNIPTSTNYGYNLQDLYGTYSVRLKALCPASVSASIAGVPCGQEFVIPTTILNAQQEIPAVITNGTWYKQDVTFQVTVVNLANQVIGTAETKVTVNAVPFNW